MIAVTTDKPEVKKESWSDAFNKVVNLMIITALVAMILGFFATFGAILAINIFN